MGRAPRLEFAGATYHVFARGNRRERIFLDDEDYRDYLADLRRLAQVQQVAVLAYCLMPNHPHLCVRTNGVPLSVFMQRLNTRHAKRFNAKYRVHGHLHEGRYRALLVDESRYLLSLVRYIHQNPVRAGLARTAREWPYSSRTEYTAKETWVSRDDVLSYFASPSEFEAFTDSPVPPDDKEVFRRASRGFRAAGASGFAQRLLQVVHQQGERKALWIPLGQVRAPAGEHIVSTAEAWLSQHAPAITMAQLQSVSSREPLRSTRRRLAVYLRSHHHALRSIAILLQRDLSTVSRFAASAEGAAVDLQICKSGT